MITPFQRATMISLAERQALGQFLNDWPAGLNFQQVMNMMHGDVPKNEHGRYVITIWQPLEDHDFKQVASFITEAKDNLVGMMEHLFTELE
ncbi:hypothetical protein QN372_00305 [Undibacterium sp. RTI2.1]|uniref:hypothetical protein n=1 Tax=unclassified Undibacterium TaxID=2630295 RepID=UPI002AB3573C|nr:MULTISPECIES: hypothetical protein [unclassified Undibacterium]MDY7537580.1 hypothetical protein [Undibacterium sp. 5I1]MEB0029180.1 hypothetical protein [Undibacterium sp. RTI2.1]MEB0115488.1 hypothetical protein [Undibacterium sp. RTI2.2]MEB0231965.1 hypothetical protein [Undibacterium sp. 10I3]MEB0256316.1 hypothetical protein [Undibacterium sp. 5I1]